MHKNAEKAVRGFTLDGFGLVISFLIIFRVY